MDLEWVLGVVDDRADNLSGLGVVLSVFGHPTSLDVLDDDWPMGFASFEVCVRNGTRDVSELQASELEQLGAILIHPVRQVLAHY